eukprot:m.760716 g.760716  ORF g.760716 m.760716 type:complete len:608 (-) comp23203_c0_seq1:341-2164(-)
MMRSVYLLLAVMAMADAQFISCAMCGTGGDKPSIQSITFRNNGASPAHVSVPDVTCSGCGTVAPGGDIVLFGTGTGGSSGKSKSKGMGSTGFPTNTDFVINGQTLELHTSCSQPLGLGTSVGQFTIVAFVTSASNSAIACGPPPPPPTPLPPTTAAPTTPPPPTPCSLAACAYASGIRRLTFEFTSNVGRGYFHPSQEGHVLIEELYATQNSARVVVSSTQSATGLHLGGATNDFRVKVGERFSLVGANSGLFGQSVLIRVAGNKIRFNTNCGAEVRIGDVFGSVQVVGYENSNGVTCGADPAESVAPTDAPTDAPTATPADVPTDTPTDAPSDSPTDVPTTSAPTDVPSDAPTDVPTTAAPTDTPTDSPTDVPTTAAPTDVPTDTPTDTPTDAPSDVPTDAPSDAPSDAPTDTPTDSPTDVPTTAAPTDTPTDAPTDAPTDPTAPPTTSPPTFPFVGGACAGASAIRRLTIEFTSNTGRGSFHPSQDSEVLIQELSAYQPSARVVVLSTQSATGFFQGVATNDFRVSVGERFSLIGARPGGEFGASVLLKVAGNKIRFNTNCNAQITIGDDFGSVRIVGYENDIGRACGVDQYTYRKARSLRGRQL